MESSLVSFLSFWFWLFYFFLSCNSCYLEERAVGGHDLSGTMIDLKRLGVDTLGLWIEGYGWINLDQLGKDSRKMTPLDAGHCRRQQNIHMLMFLQHPKLLSSLRLFLILRGVHYAIVLMKKHQSVRSALVPLAIRKGCTAREEKKLAARSLAGVASQFLGIS
jgi:hypothetical protein